MLRLGALFETCKKPARRRERYRQGCEPRGKGQTAAWFLGKLPEISNDMIVKSKSSSTILSHVHRLCGLEMAGRGRISRLQRFRQEPAVLG